jgi:hypothetical protein
MSVPRGAILALLLAAVLGCARTREPAKNKPAQGAKAPLANGQAEPDPAAPYEKARADLVALTKAVKAYHAAHKAYPKTLEDLTKPEKEGGRPLVGPEMLTDPWGQPYVLDAKTLESGTGTPLIYSQGPYKDKGTSSRIPNWK